LLKKEMLVEINIMFLTVDSFTDNGETFTIKTLTGEVYQLGFTAAPDSVWVSV
jgi:hypothetical protein